MPKVDKPFPAALRIMFDFDQVLADTESLAHLRESRKWVQYRKLLRSLPPVSGVGPMLHAAADRGFTLAIVTHSPSFAPAMFVEKEEWPIDHIVGWHEFRRRKPDPRCLIVALDRAQANAHSSWYVGDLPSDIEAAKRAGVKSIGAGWAATDSVALRRAEPDHYVDTVAQLHDYICTLPV